MNCKTTKKNLLLYIDKQLSEKVKNEITQHITNCNQCSNLYNFMLAELKSIKEDKIKPQPYLYTKIQQRIDLASESTVKSWFKIPVQRILQPALYTVSVAAAIWIGIFFGAKIPTAQQLILANDIRTIELQDLSDELNINEFDNETIEMYLLTEYSD